MPLSVSGLGWSVTYDVKKGEAYSVSGLDSDATATVTFSDGTNSVVGQSGVADLSTLTD